MAIIKLMIYDDENESKVENLISFFSQFGFGQQ
jgi:hypothetical protein